MKFLIRSFKINPLDPKTKAYLGLAFEAENKNFARLGYKRIFPIDYIEYIAPGITAYTNFKGQNGFGPELSVGWFTLFDTFTLYTRYRYNFKPNGTNSNFHEINLGLYTRFLSLYL